MAHIVGTSFVLADIDKRVPAMSMAHTVQVGATQFAYVSRNIGPTGGEVGVYTVAEDGSLTFVDVILATEENGLSGAWEIQTYTIGSTSYLVAAGQRSDALSVFELSENAPYLELVDTVFDSEDARYEIDNTRYVSVFEIEGNTFIVATSKDWWGSNDANYDEGVTVFRAEADGTLSFASSFASVAGVSVKSGRVSDPFEIDGTHYFVVGDNRGAGFAIMEIDPVTGALTVAVPSVSVRGATREVSTYLSQDVAYIFVPTSRDELHVFTYEGGTDATLVTTVVLPEGFRVDMSMVYEVGDSVLVAVGTNASSGDGIIIYDFDAASGGLTELQWMRSKHTDHPDSEPIEDIEFGPMFEMNGVPYALITSDDDGTLLVYAIGGGDDVLTGTVDADLIEGFGGNDTLTGLAGDDVLHGFDGNDSLFGNRGDDEIAGGFGDDYIEAGLGDDLVYGGAGEDVMLGFAGNDRMFGQAGNDTLKGGAGADELSGNDGDDVLQGGSGHDILLGQAGADAINGGAGNDTMDGGADNDRMFGGAGNDVMEGGAGDDLLKGNDGDDTLNGGAGNDTLAGQTGDDVLNGGAGNDVIQGGAGRDQITAGAGNDLLTGGSAEDTFVFDIVAATGGGFNRITDFTDGVDLLDLTAYAYADAGAALGGAVQAGTDVNLTLDDGQIVWLENFQIGDLDGADLLLFPFA